MPTATPTQAVLANIWTQVAAAPSLAGSVSPRITVTGSGTIGVRIKNASGTVQHESFGPTPQIAGVPSGGSTVEVKAQTTQTLSLSITY